MLVRMFLIVASVAIPTAAQAAPIPNLTPQQLQRIERDLVGSRSQDFFQAGRLQLEREIRNLERPKPEAPVLQVEPVEQRPMPKEQQGLPRPQGQPQNTNFL